MKATTTAFCTLALLAANARADSSATFQLGFSLAFLDLGNTRFTRQVEMGGAYVDESALGSELGQSHRVGVAMTPRFYLEPFPIRNVGLGLSFGLGPFSVGPAPDATIADRFGTGGASLAAMLFGLAGPEFQVVSGDRAHAIVRGGIGFGGRVLLIGGATASSWIIQPHASIDYEYPSHLTVGTYVGVDAVGNMAGTVMWGVTFGVTR